MAYCEVPVKIIHNFKLQERKKYLLSKLTNFTDVNFVEIEKNHPTFPFEMYSGGDEVSWRMKHLNLYTPIPNYRKLSIPEILATASHYYAMTTFSSEWCLILEDDALLPDDIADKINYLTLSTPDKVDIIFIGGGFPINEVTFITGSLNNLFIAKPPNTNTTVAYLIRKSLSLKILINFKYFDLPIDFELAYQLHQLNALVVHSQPYLIQEGSKSVYSSSIDQYRI